MLIGIDARFVLGKRRGIGNYTLNLIENLAEIDDRNHYILYVHKPDTEKLLPQKPNFTVKKLLPSNYLVWEQVMLPLAAINDRLDVLHCTGNTGPIYSYGKRNYNTVLTLHDIMYLKDYYLVPKSSSLYQRFGREYRRFFVPKVIKITAKIITVSGFSKNDILTGIPNLDENSISVIYESYSSQFDQVDRDEAEDKVRNKYNIKSPYILALGAIDPRKNTKLIVESFLDLKFERNIQEKLVVVGEIDWHSINRNPHEDVYSLEFVPLEDLAALYKCATIFLYPSLYEGFGVPPLEAMACGTPVITSNVTSIPEIVGDGALQIDPHNKEELKQSTIALLNDKAFRNELSQRGLQRVQEFSWHKMAQETLKIYESVANINNNS